MGLWDECLFLRGAEQISTYFGKVKDTLLIMGKGFDPRACRFLEILSQSVQAVCLIDYTDKGDVRDEVAKETLSQENYAEFERLSVSLKSYEKKTPLYRDNGFNKVLVISESVRDAFDKAFIAEYSNIAIDVSAMPRAVAFSVIKRLRDIKDSTQKIQLLACENSAYDESIHPVITTGSAEYLPGFNTFSMFAEADSDETVWIPVLGVGEEQSFNIIADFLNPLEICPVLPFPAIDIQRGEKIIRKYGSILFQERGVEKRNIIYVPENQPVLVYQKLYETARYYEKALNIEKNRPIKFVFSSQSSKLIDIGVLLTVLSLTKCSIKAGIVVIENNGYHTSEYSRENEDLYCLCLDDNEFDW